MISFISIMFAIIFKLIFGIVQIIMIPIDSLIENSLPGMADVLDNISDYIDVITDGLGWAISATGIPATGIAFIVGYYIFALSVLIPLWSIKLGLKWYKAIK